MAVDGVELPGQFEREEPCPVCYGSAKVWDVALDAWTIACANCAGDGIVCGGCGSDLITCPGEGVCWKHGDHEIWMEDIVIDLEEVEEDFD
jgi:DnaJ-class molecular chaperone